MSGDLIECKVHIPRALLERLPNIKSANPKVSSAEDHLKEAFRMYVLLHAAHADGKPFFLGKGADAEKLNMFA